VFYSTSPILWYLSFTQADFTRQPSLRPPHGLQYAAPLSRQAKTAPPSLFPCTRPGLLPPLGWGRSLKGAYLLIDGLAEGPAEEDPSGECSSLRLQRAQSPADAVLGNLPAGAKTRLRIEGAGGWPQLCGVGGRRSGRSAADAGRST
jgi:hypothetical protein